MIKFLLIFILCLIPSVALSDSEVGVASSGPSSYSSIEKCWSKAPSVYICNDLTIPASRVGLAISYWEKLGYTFDKIMYNYSGPKCHGMHGYGDLIITIPNSNFDTSKMAITNTTSDVGSKEIYYSIIQIPSFNTTKERVLEHELGHAFGWNHSNRKYYIMNKDWRLGGYDSLGLSYNRYLSLCQDLNLKDNY